jgi:hypothetical protein
LRELLHQIALTLGTIEMKEATITQGLEQLVVGQATDNRLLDNHLLLITEEILLGLAIQE